MTDALPFLLGTVCLLLGRPLGVLLYFPALILICYAGLRLRRRGQGLGKNLMVALPLSLFCFLVPPDLSDDYHRYLWEGFVQNEGYSPYRHAPLDLADRLEHPSRDLVNHPELTAIYPPLAQLCFRLAAALSPSVLAWKLLIGLALFIALSSEFGRANFAFLVVSPLLLFEGVWNAHLDVLGVAVAVGLIWAMDKRYAAWAGALLGGLIGLKLLPVLLAPACLLSLDGRGRLRFISACTLTLFLIFLPYLGELAQVFASFRAFAGQWYFNNPLFLLLDAWLPQDWARPFMGVGLLLGCALVLLPERDLRWRCSATWMVLLLFSPTVYPWYLLWLLAFVPKQRGQWVDLAYGASFLSYLVLLKFRATGEWQTSLGWMLPEWALLLYCFYRILRPTTAKELTR